MKVLFQASLMLMTYAMNFFLHPTYAVAPVMGEGLDSSGQVYSNRHLRNRHVSDAFQKVWHDKSALTKTSGKSAVEETFNDQELSHVEQPQDQVQNQDHIQRRLKKTKNKKIVNRRSKNGRKKSDKMKTVSVEKIQEKIDDLIFDIEDQQQEIVAAKCGTTKIFFRKLGLNDENFHIQKQSTRRSARNLKKRGYRKKKPSPFDSSSMCDELIDDLRLLQQDLKAAQDEISQAYVALLGKERNDLQKSLIEIQGKDDCDVDSRLGYRNRVLKPVNCEKLVKNISKQQEVVSIVEEKARGFFENQLTQVSEEMISLKTMQTQNSCPIDLDPTTDLCDELARAVADLGRQAEEIKTSSLELGLSSRSPSSMPSVSSAPSDTPSNVPSLSIAPSSAPSGSFDKLEKLRIDLEMDMTKFEENGCKESVRRNLLLMTQEKVSTSFDERLLSPFDCEQLTLEISKQEEALVLLENDVLALFVEEQTQLSEDLTNVKLSQEDQECLLTPNAGTDTCMGFATSIETFEDMLKMSELGIQMQQENLVSLQEEYASCLNDLDERRAECEDFSNRLEIIETKLEEKETQLQEKEIQLQQQQTILVTTKKSCVGTEKVCTALIEEIEGNIKRLEQEFAVASNDFEATEAEFFQNEDNQNACQSEFKATETQCFSTDTYIQDLKEQIEQILISEENSKKGILEEISKLKASQEAEQCLFQPKASNRDCQEFAAEIATLQTQLNDLETTVSMLGLKLPVTCTTGNQDEVFNWCNSNGKDCCKDNDGMYDFDSCSFNGILTLCDGACVGTNACLDFGNAKANLDNVDYTIGPNACVGEKACEFLGVVSPGSIAIEAGSCIGKLACQQLGGMSAITVGIDSCKGDSACTSIGFTSSSVDFGDGVCTTENPCDASFGSPLFNCATKVVIAKPEDKDTGCVEASL